MNLRLRIRHPSKSRNVRVQVTLVVVALLLRTLKIRRVLPLLKKLTPALKLFPQLCRDLDLCETIATESEHCPLHVRCLEFAVCHWFLLQAEGQCPELVLGVRLINGRLTSHAWVELDGQSLDQERHEPQILYTPIGRHS